MEIQEYNETDAALTILTEKYALVIYDVTTTAGMASARVARAEIKGYRTFLEKKRTELKAPALERSRLIDAEALRIKTELLLLEGPIDEQIKAEEARKEAEKAAKAEAERMRITNIVNKIEQINFVCDRAAAWTAEETARVVTNLTNLVVDAENYQEYLPNALDAQAEALKKLTDIYSEKLAQEAEAARIEAEHIAAEAQREAEHQERERLAQIEFDRLAGEREELRLQQEAFAAEQAESIRLRAESERAAQAVRDAEAAEVRRQQDEAAEIEREEARQATIAAEASRAEADKKAKAAEKARKLAEAKCKDATEAFQNILAICNDKGVEGQYRIDQIALIAEANI